MKGRLALLGLLCVFLNGCSSSAAPRPMASSANSVGEEVPHKPPFEMEITEDVNDGQHVYVRGLVHVRAVWPLEEVAFRLSSFADGEPQSSKLLPLNSVLSQSGALVAGESRNFEVHMPVGAAREYQLELVWGDEARAAVQAEAVKALQIRDFRSEYVPDRCQDGDCPQKLVLYGKLFNSGTLRVNSATVGVSLHWVPEGAELDLASRIPENEERVEIANLNLEAGSERDFSFEIDRALPRQAGGAFTPFVRIVPVQ